MLPVVFAQKGSDTSALVIGTAKSIINAISVAERTDEDREPTLKPCLKSPYTSPDSFPAEAHRRTGPYSSSFAATRPST